jgi:hypothetical protein
MVYCEAHKHNVMNMNNGMNLFNPFVVRNLVGMDIQP